MNKTLEELKAMSEEELLKIAYFTRRRGDAICLNCPRLIKAKHFKGNVYSRQIVCKKCAAYSRKMYG